MDREPVKPWPTHQSRHVGTCAHYPEKRAAVSHNHNPTPPLGCSRPDTSQNPKPPISLSSSPLLASPKTLAVAVGRRSHSAGVHGGGRSQALRGPGSHRKAGTLAAAGLLPSRAPGGAMAIQRLLASSLVAATPRWLPVAADSFLRRRHRPRCSPLPAL